jgi:hypothetical protein
MKNFHASLSEKEKRRYAAVEAVKLGHGGKGYLCGLLGCDYKTLVRGIAELQDESLMSQGRIRQPGGGRKRIIEHAPGIEAAFLRVVEQHTAGSPMNEELKWTNLTREQLAQGLAAAGFEVSVTVVDQLLEKHHFRRRQAFKTTAIGRSVRWAPLSGSSPLLMRLPHRATMEHDMGKLVG